MVEAHPRGGLGNSIRVLTRTHIAMLNPAAADKKPSQAAALSGIEEKPM